ncbi:hypothetical protein GYMLUDRAFT_245489 [Collybiopsis luxurians FD-317 M1]|uniref:DUF6534 domain-containing protein n=1 Tax=Collybiopsis luxurians FD-317 M1 TaxID=944289 RepID=A0A0D0CTJ1_9AGAR|nr:hypothetical protein GYMLUDRAFT_245489 [Collybiopsis luxurians FD-317 M1]
MTIYDSTLGVVTVGVMIAGVLFGLFTCQVYMYHKNFPEEKKWIRFGLVDGMWLLELAHTICIFHLVYFYTVTHYGETEVFLALIVPPSWPAAVLCHSMVAILAQSYFTYRIARFGAHHPYVIPVVCSILMFCQLLGDTAVAVYLTNEDMQAYMKLHEWLIIGPLLIRSVVDMINSVALVYYLVYERNNAYKRTIAVIDKLILWSVGESRFVSALDLIAQQSRKLDPSRNRYCDEYGRVFVVDFHAWIALYLILPKVFSNTMLANMNSRIHLREMQPTMVISPELELHFATPPVEEPSQSLHFQGVNSTHGLNSTLGDTHALDESEPPFIPFLISSV